MTLLKEGQVRRLGEIALVVQQVEDTHRLLAQHVDYCLQFNATLNPVERTKSEAAKSITNALVYIDRKSKRDKKCSLSSTSVTTV